MANLGRREMNRRAFLSDSSMAALVLSSPSRLLQLTTKEEGRRDGEGPDSTSQTISVQVLPGTAPLTLQGDLAAKMVDGIHQFLLHQIQEAAQERGRLWQRNYQSVEDYHRSVSPNRERFRQIIGAVDQRVP